MQEIYKRGPARPRGAQWPPARCGHPWGAAAALIQAVAALVKAVAALLRFASHQTSRVSCNRTHALGSRQRVPAAACRPTKGSHFRHRCRFRKHIQLTIVAGRDPPVRAQGIISIMTLAHDTQANPRVRPPGLHSRSTRAADRIATSRVPRHVHWLRGCNQSLVTRRRGDQTRQALASDFF